MGWQPRRRSEGIRGEDATLSEGNKERQPIRVWGGVPVTGKGRESPCFSLHLGDCSPEDGAGAMRSMQKGRSVASGRKRLAGYENKWARLGARGGGAGWYNPPPLRHAP